MMDQRTTRYKISARYEINKFYVDAEGRETGYTGERLSIDDTMDMGSALDLVGALDLIANLHAAMRAEQVLSALTHIRTAAGLLEEAGQ